MDKWQNNWFSMVHANCNYVFELNCNRKKFLVNAKWSDSRLKKNGAHSVKNVEIKSVHQLIKAMRNIIAAWFIILQFWHDTTQRSEKQMINEVLILAKNSKFDRLWDVFTSENQIALFLIKIDNAIIFNLDGRNCLNSLRE